MIWSWLIQLWKPNEVLTYDEKWTFWFYLIGKESIEGFERTGEAEIVDRWETCGTSSIGHLEEHADAGAGPVRGSFEENKVAGGELGSSAPSPAQAWKGGPEVEALCKQLPLFIMSYLF